MSLPTTTTMAGNNVADSNEIRPMNKKKNNEDTWVEEITGSLMVVATVIATLTFQIVINPPGGVWQSDMDTKGGCADDTTCLAGTSVLATGRSSNDQKENYDIFILLCTISFSFSIAVILFLLTLFSLLRYRFVMWGFRITMSISVMCLAGAYMTAILMVINPLNSNNIVLGISKYFARFLGGIIALLCLVLSFRFLFWQIKMFYRCLTFKTDP